ncbi:ABC transporter permease [Actinomyces minihominis]|uniref:ABC transporter permease n=1 Tax=Actinomyces minihominis TaxID=2002838 RepID=UPI000C0819D5|nr:ABC transporter permease [Actinomyces minihominis]
MSTAIDTPVEDLTRERNLGFLKNPVLIALVITILLIVVGQIVSPGFGSYNQVLAMLRVASFLGFIAIGQTIVILSGGDGIDLSVGKVATLGAIVASKIMEGSNDNLILGILIPLAVGCAIGFFNGLGILLLRIPPFVMTLGMSGVVTGIILAYTGGVAGGRSAPALTALVNGRWLFNIPGVLYLWVIATILVTIFLRRTWTGWNIFAVGANRTAARLSGIPVTRTVLLSYVLSGFFAVMGGLMLLGYTETVFLNLADNLTLPSVAAVVIGGTLVAGGIGGYVGSAIGAVLLTVLSSFLTTINMPESGRIIINGTVLILLLAVYGRQRKLRS